MKSFKSTLVIALATSLTFTSLNAPIAAAGPAESSSPAVEASEESIAETTSETLAEATSTIPIEPGELSDQGVLVPEDGSEDLVLLTDDGDEPITLGLPVDEDAEARITDEGAVVLPSSNDGAEVLIQELDVTAEPLLQAATRTVFTIESAEVDPLFSMSLDIPEGATTQENADGSITVVNDVGDILAYVAPPWAVDAAGQDVDTWYEIEDGHLYQYVDHLSREHTYPVVADPAFLVPVLLFGGRIIIQRVVAAAASQAGRQAVAAVASSGARVAGRAVLRSFTKSNYRHNLIVWTNRNPGTRCDAHHTLPQKFRPRFERSGFTGNDSIDHPRYVVWWEASDHRSEARKVNAAWEDWWDDRNLATKASVLNKRSAVLRQYPPRCP